MHENECGNLLRDIRSILQNPSELSAERERQQLEDYCNEWEQAKGIDAVWREDSLFFPLIYVDRLVSKLSKLMNGNREAFLEAVSEIQAPFILRECLGLAGLARSWDTALWTLEHAPVVTKKPDGIWNLKIDSVPAPVMLNFLMEYLAHENLMRASETPDAEEPDITDETDGKIAQIVDALYGRDDGFYLAFHYVRLILEKEPVGMVYDNFVEKLSGTFSEQAQKLLIQDGRLVMDETAPQTDDAVKSLASTGQLRHTEGPDCLITFRAIMAFLNIKGHEKLLFQTFQAVLACEASGFYTNDFKWRSMHAEIAELLLRQDNPPQAWDTLSELMFSARQKLSQNYFGGQSMALRDRFRFLQLVSLRIMDGLGPAMPDETKRLWKKFWRSGLDDARRFSKYRDDFSLQYLAYLICYYCVCCAPKKDEGIRAMTGIFEEIESMPLLIVMSVQLLITNGFDRSAFIHGPGSDFFSSAFKRAREAARGRKQYAWVERFLSDYRF